MKLPSIAQATSFADLLTLDEVEPESTRELKRQRRRVVVPLAVVGGLVTIWCAVAPLSGAIVAPGQLKVELNRKTIQHQEGGIVREILVRNGQKVRAGQPLVVIGDVRTDAELSLLQEQLRAERIRNERAAAEASLKREFHIRIGSDDPRAIEALSRETALFEARRRTLDEQISSLSMQVREAQSQAEALGTQVSATEQAAKLAADELELNERLIKDGFIQRARLIQLQRAEADYRSRLGENRGDLAMTRQRIGELQARIAQTRNQYQQQAVDEMKVSAAKIRELEERVRPSQDQSERQYVRSPVDGEVMTLRVAAVGDVIGPREPLVDIVPASEKLVVEAHIRPLDINNVRTDQPAEVRLSSFDSRTTPLLPGKVIFISPDRVTNQEGESWYVANVEVDASALHAHPEIRLQPGMPAELFVTTPERTLVQYLTKPLTAFASRAMREP
jgi:HlyD family type I secretion membrane fusion protein